MNVEHGQVDGLLAQYRERLGGRFGLHHLVAGPPQPARQHVPLRRGVVADEDDQDRGRAASVMAGLLRVEGSTTTNVLPAPSSVDTSIVAPSAVATRWTNDSPSPVPFAVACSGVRAW